jgi:ankyrin repeat protein
MAKLKGILKDRTTNKSQPNLIGKELATDAKRKINPKKQKELNGKLLEAAKKGNGAQINRLLDAGADIDARDNHRGQTALMHAAEEGLIETCELLVNRGANVNATDFNHSETILMHAVQFKDNLAVCELLIENGADVNAALDSGFLSGRTVLMGAAYEGNKNICNLLVRNGSDALAEDGRGWTASALAEKNGKTETVLFLESMERLQKTMGKEYLGAFMSNFNDCIRR